MQVRRRTFWLGTVSQQRTMFFQRKMKVWRARMEEKSFLLSSSFRWDRLRQGGSWRIDCTIAKITDPNRIASEANKGRKKALPSKKGELFNQGPMAPPYEGIEEWLPKVIKTPTTSSVSSYYAASAHKYILRAMFRLIGDLQNWQV